MTASRTILYLGTYERDYPRNQQLIRLFRQADCRVVEIHQPFWERFQDKSRLPVRWSEKLRAVLWMIRAYLSLVVHAAGWLRRADAVTFGYIGQIDMLVLAPVFRLFRVPVVFNPLVTLTDTVVEDRQLAQAESSVARLIRVIDRIALKLASTVIVDTPENAAYLEDRFGVVADKVRVIDVGADEALFSGVAGQRRASNVIHVLFYGKMIPLHGIETILAAIERLQARGDSNYCFEIVGRGQQEHLVAAFREHYPHAPVEYRPWVAYRHLPQRIACADVVLGVFGPGEKAGRVIPNKVYQAMAMGAPIITRDSPAVRRVLRHDHSALLVPRGDPDALANAIEDLRDAELRGRLGQNARAAFKQWGSDAALSASVGELLSQLVPAGEPDSRQERSA